MVTLCKRSLFAVVLMFWACGAVTKVNAFDYKRYSLETKQIRSLTPVANDSKVVKKGTKNAKSSLGREVVQKLLEALDSDLVPAKMFRTQRTFSLYFKPAKVTKFGVKYRF